MVICVITLLSSEWQRLRNDAFLLAHSNSSLNGKIWTSTKNSAQFLLTNFSSDFFCWVRDWVPPCCTQYWSGHHLFRVVSCGKALHWCHLTNVRKWCHTLPDRSLVVQRRVSMKHDMRGQHIIILCMDAQTGLSSQSVINFLGSYRKSSQLEGCLSTQNEGNSILVDGKKLPVASILIMVINLLNSPCNEAIRRQHKDFILWCYFW